MKVCKSFTGICLWILISVCVASCGPAESDHDVPDQKSPESFVKSDINDLWKEAYIKYREYPSDLGSAERVREIAQMMPTNDDAQMALAVVDRPEPLRPSKATISPGCRVKLIPCST